MCLLHCVVDENIADLQVSASPDALLTSQDWINISNVVLCTNESSTDNTKSSLETTGITDNERMERIAENINYLLEKNTNEKEVKYDEHINYLLEKNTNEKEVLYDHDVSQSDKSSSATEPTLTDEERMNRIATDIENRSEKVSCESFSMSPIITDDERVERIAANVGYQLEQTKCDSGVDSGFSDTQSLQDWEKPHTAVNVPSLSVDSVKDHVSTEMLMDILKKAQDKSEHLATMPPEVDSTDSSSDGTKSPVIVIDYKHGKADTNCDEDYLLDDMKMGASKLHPACSENATDIGVGLSPEVPFNDGTDNTCQDSNIYMSNRRLRNNYCDEQEQIVAYTTRRPKRNDEKKKNVYDDRCSSDVLYTKEYVPTEIAKHYRKRRCSGIIHSGSDSAAEIPLQFISKTFVVPQLQVSDKNVDLSAEQLKRGPEGERRWVKVTDNPLDIPLLHTYKDKFSSQGYLLDNVNDHMVPEEYPGVLQKAKKENSNEHFGLDGLAKKHDFPTSSFSGRGDIDMRNIDKHYHANNRTDSSDSKTVLSPRYPLQDVDYYNDEITNQKENPEKLRKTKKENRSDYFGLFGLAGKDDFLTCTGNISRRHDIDMRCHEQNSAVSSDSRISLTNDKENMSGLMRRSEYFGVTNFTKEPSSIKVVENISGVKSTGKSINSLARNILHARIVEDMDDNYPETEQDNVFDIMQLSKDFDKKQSHDIHSKSEFTHGQKWNKSHRSDMQKSNEVLPPNDKDIVIPPKCAAGRFIPQMWDVMRRILNANNKIDYFQKTISDGVKRTTAMLKDHANSWSKKRRQFADQFKILNTAFASLQSIAKAAHFLSQQENTKVKCNLDTIAKDLKKTDQILWRMVSYSHTEGDVVLKARDRCSMVIAAIKAKAKQIERSLDYPSETDSCHTAVDNKATVASSSGSSLFSFGKGEFSCCVDREDRPFESIAVIMSKVWKKKMEIEKIIAEQEMDEKILMDANMDSDSDGVMGEQQCSKPKKRLVLDTTFTGGCVDEAVKSQDPAPRLTYNQYTDRYENDGSRSGSRSVDTPSQACTQHISSLKSPLRSSTCANRSVLDLHLSITQTKDNMFSHALTKNVEDNTQSIIASEKNTSPEQDKQSVSLVLMPDKGLSEVKQERNHQGILKNNSANHIKALNTTCKPVFPPHIKGDENMNLRGKPDKVLPIADTARQNGGGRSIYTSSQVCTQGSSSMNTASATQEISRKIYHLKKSPLRGSLLQRSTCANRSVLDLPLPISQTKQDITRNVEENTQSIIASEKITSHHQDKQSMPLVLMPEKGQAEGKREPNQQGLLKENSANHIKALNTTCKPVFPPHVKGDENNNLIGKPEKVLPIEDSARQNGGGRSIDTSSQASTQGNSSENTASATREISRKIYHLKKSTLRGSLLQRSTCANRSVLDLPLPISQTKENVFSQDITKNVEENTQSIIASEKNASPEQDKQSVPSVLMPEVEQERNNQGLPKEISVNYIKAHNTTCKSVFPPHVKGDENMNLKGKTEKVLSISDNARQNCGGKSIDTSSQVCAQYISSCKSSGNVQQAMLIEKGNSSINTSVKTHKISCEIYNLKKSPLRSSSPRSYTCPNRSVLDIPLTAITPKENVLSHDLTKNVNENTKSIIASEKNTSHQQDKQSMPLVLELEERQSEVKPERNQQGILKENSVNQIKAHITTCKPVFPPFVKDNEKIYLKGEPEKVLPIADNRRPNVRRDVLGDAITREAALAKLVSLPSKPIVTRADDLLPVNILSAGVSSSTSLPEMIAGIVNIPRPVLRFHVKNKRKENVCMKSVFGDDSPSETETDDDKSPDNHMYEANRPMSPVSKVATINAALSSGEHHADKIAAKTFSTNLNVNQQCSNKTKGEGFNKTQITMVNSLLQANTISQGKNSIMEVTNIEMNRLATDEFMRTESNLFETTLKNTRAESVDNNEPSKTQILTTTSVDPGGSESLKENIPGSSGMVDSNLKTVGKGNSKVKNSQEHMTKVRGICGNLCMRLQKSSSPGQWMVKTCNVMDDDKYDPANNSRDMKFDKQQTDGRSGRIIKCGCGDDPEYPKMNDTVEPLVKKSVVLKSSTRDVDNCVKTNHTSISSNYTNATYTSIIPGRHNNFPDGELLQNQGVPSANVSTNCDRNQHVNTARFSDRNHPSLLIDNMLNKNETSFDKTRLSPTSPNVPAIVIEPLGMEEEEEMRRTYEQLYMANKQTPLHDNACIRRSPIQDTPIFESYFTTDYLINSKLVADSQASTETQVSLPATSPPSTEYKTLGTHGHPTHCNDGVLAKFVTSPFDLSREKNTLSSSSIFSDLVMQPINNDHQYSSKDRQTTVSSTAAVATDTVQTQMTSDGSNSSSLCPSSGTPLLNVIASDHQYSLNHDDNVARMTPMVTVQPPAWTGSYPATAFAFVNPPPTYGNYIYNHHTGQWQPMGIYQGYYGVHS